MVRGNLSKLVIMAFIMCSRIIIAEQTVKFDNYSEAFRIKREGVGPKKYLIFPQGSNVQLVYCMTVGALAKPSGFFTVGVTAGLAWELPYRNTVPHRKPAEVYHRRSRRELYRKVELMLSTRGLDGKACVRKALCRAGKRNSSHVGKGSFMDEMLHSIFTLPNSSSTEEPHSEYDEAHKAPPEDDCQEIYPTCPEIFQ